MQHIDVILFLAIVIIFLGCWITVLYARYSKRVETLENYNQHLKEQREKLLKVLEKNRIIITSDMISDKEEQSWGQKEYEHYKSKQNGILRN